MKNKKELYVLKTANEVRAIAFTEDDLCQYVINKKIGTFAINVETKKRKIKTYLDMYSDKLIYQTDEYSVIDEVSTEEDENVVSSLISEEKYKLVSTINSLRDYLNDEYDLKDKERKVILEALLILKKKSKPKKFLGFINFSSKDITDNVLSAMKELKIFK